VFSENVQVLLFASAIHGEVTRVKLSKITRLNYKEVMHFETKSLIPGKPFLGAQKST